VNYDPLSHSRHNAGDRSTKVGHEIKSVEDTSGTPLYRNDRKERDDCYVINNKQQQQLQLILLLLMLVAVVVVAAAAEQ